jgi:hypothetical protein
MLTAKERTREALNHRPIPAAPLIEVVPRSSRTLTGSGPGTRVLREIDPEGAEFGARRSLGGAWRPAEAGPVEEGVRDALARAGLPQGPWIYLRETSTPGAGRDLAGAVRRSVILLAASSDISSAAAARWTGLALEAARVAGRLAGLKGACA